MVQVFFLTFILNLSDNFKAELNVFKKTCARNVEGIGI